MKKTIVYLYAELMGYQIPVLREYVDKYDYDVHVVHAVSGKLSKYEIPELTGITFYDKDQFKGSELLDLVRSLDPSIVYVSGWMYFIYTKVIYSLRKKNIPVVTGFDDIWHGTLKQRIGKLIFPFFKKKFFSHAWVAGPYQYEYAKKLGFVNEEIIYNCLSADVSKFISCKKKHDFGNSIPHNFLYVGRFHEVKGVDILYEAWKRLGKDRGDWKLTMIGNGPLLADMPEMESFEIRDFMQPEELISVLEDYSCLVIPSRNEQWSVAMHEFAVAGFPMISSHVCGAIPLFIIPNYKTISSQGRF
ncbi:MAG: glycosyltransferase [Pedobacter sp.]|nr:MAG: glycosyltransferase [Pedobacter sp.]